MRGSRLTLFIWIWVSVMNSTQNLWCECGNPVKPMSDADHDAYMAEYGDTPLACDECSVLSLEMAGWTPETFAKFTPNLAKVKQKKIAIEIIKLKRAYRALREAERSARREIRRAERAIKRNESDPFFKHRKNLLVQSIDKYAELIEVCRSGTQSALALAMRLINDFDALGKAETHEYAAILSTSHVHVERSLGESNGLMEMILDHVEDGANVGDFISSSCVLHEIVMESAIQEIMRNRDLRAAALDKVSELFVKEMGRPLPMYALAASPDGEQVLMRVPPKLSIAN